MKTYHVIGLMSGTSLDGLDIAYCSFTFGDYRWKYSILKTLTVPYTTYWLEGLANAHRIKAEQLIARHSMYGKFLGNEVKKFIKENNIENLDFIASHGHTILHQPDKGITFQLGNGADIAAVCDIPVVSDFRTIDVALKGQGAPLVPVGDELLFPEYQYCLNLGGFSNISFSLAGKRIAFDICPVNIVLNRLALFKHQLYDNKGELAKSGTINKNMLEQLNGLEYYKRKAPKSLGREWVEDYFYPLLDKDAMHSVSTISVEDKLATVTEHAAMQIAKVIIENSDKKSKVLITGGGAYNTFLLDKLKKLLHHHEVVVPDSNLVKFKEALIFAFLGVLRREGMINTYKSVTGAKHDSSGGVIWNQGR